MGLFQQAALLQNRSAESDIGKKKAGLLKRIRNSSSYDLILESFKDYLVSIHAERGGILCPSEDGHYILLLPVGFDLTTVRRFCPHQSFLRQKIGDNPSWVSYTKPVLDSFQTFFSSHENDSLSAVHIKKIDCALEAPCYLVVADSFLNVQRKSSSVVISEDGGFPVLLAVLQANKHALTALTAIASINQSYASMKTHAESALNSTRIATLTRISLSSLFPDAVKLQTDIALQSVYYAIVHRIARQAGSSNIIYIAKNHDLHIVLFTAQPVDIELYFYQLMKPLEKIFGSHRISHIRAEKIGIGSTVSGIMDFITGEA
jgi:hypothetical protein